GPRDKRRTATLNNPVGRRKPLPLETTVVLIDVCAQTANDARADSMHERRLLHVRRVLRGKGCSGGSPTSTHWAPEKPSVGAMYVCLLSISAARGLGVNRYRGRLEKKKRR
ncbi:unnamed protein product, partial [Laminaria digitata]